MKLPKTPSMSLNGKRALVTGASSGIGQGCAVALAQAGATVVCAARGADRLNEVVGAMKDNGWAAQSLILDQADLEALQTAMAAPFDIVVNSAGLARHKPALETLPIDFDTVMDVNLRSAYFLSVYAAQAMKAANFRGSIIHISSQMGHVGGIDRTVYSTSKHALEGMVKSMAIEWGELGIRINTICPTFIRTPLTAATLDDPDRAAWINGKIKLGRVGEVEDIMGAALYLASDAAAMVTGTHLLVDGGWTAG
ncbi:MAG: SDR family oxidoreductase [Aliishimia sp.]